MLFQTPLCWMMNGSTTKVVPSILFPQRVQNFRGTIGPEFLAEELYTRVG